MGHWKKELESWGYAPEEIRNKIRALRKPQTLASAESGDRLLERMGELGQGSLVLAPIPGSVNYWKNLYPEFMT